MTTRTVAWIPVNESFGAFVDIDLAGELTDEQIDDVRALLNERALLIFRGQTLDYDRQCWVASLFGSEVAKGGVKYVSNTVGVQGQPEPEPVLLEPETNTCFHNDYAFLPAILGGISLYGEEVEAGAEGTRFTSLRAGFLALSPEERAKLEGVVAVQAHDISSTATNQLRFKSLSGNDLVMATEHPLLYPNPRTGELVLLYTRFFTHSIVGMADDEAEAWFDRFEEILYDERVVYTHQWREGDLVLWDNIAVQHARELQRRGEADAPRRSLRRVTFGSKEADTALTEYHDRIAKVLNFAT